MADKNYTDFSPKPQAVGEDKFNTCQFRTAERITKRIAGGCCGQSRELTEFACDQLQIFPLAPVTCANCDVYVCKPTT